MKKSYLFVLAVLVALLLAACNNDPAHVHEWGEWETVIAATCTKDGVAARKCKTCGDLDTETQVIKATGHSWDTGKVTTEATCSAEGVKTFTCSACKETKTEAVAKLAHTYGEVETTEATCDKDGEKYRICSVCNDKKVDETITKLGHNWNEGSVTTAATCSAEGTKTYTCSRCSGTKTETIAKTDHAYGEVVTTEATCEKDGEKYRICSVCNDKKVDETITNLGHSWGEGSVTTAATCSAEGMRTFTCSRCSGTKTETIAKTDHTYGELQTKAATCKEDGKKYKVCSGCGKEDIQEVLPKSEAGHTYGELQTVAATCKEDGKKYKVCSVCGKEDIQEVLSKSEVEHTYGELLTVAATCKEDGKKYKVCSVCGKEDIQELLSKSTVEHTWNSGEITTDPTCKDEGVRTFTCTVCGDKSKTEPVPADSSKHSYSWVKDTEATFINPKTEKGACSICGDETMRTTDEYKSIKGYWKTEVPTEMGMAGGTCWYFSFGEDSSTAVGVDIVMPYGEGVTLGERYDDTYSWTVDDTTKKRTKFNWVSKMMYDTVAAAPSAETITGEDGATKDSITLVITMQKGSSSSSVNLILERISEAPHEHVFGDNPEYTPSSMAADYHSAPTKCEGDLHPAFDCIFEHRFDSESETPEICLDCGAEKSYRIEIGQDNGYGYSTVDSIYVTKSKGFTPGNTYTSESGTTYTGITEWKNETTGESYDIGKKITPTEDGMVLVFTIGSSKTGE